MDAVSPVGEAAAADAPVVAADWDAVEREAVAVAPYKEGVARDADLDASDALSVAADGDADANDAEGGAADGDASAAEASSAEEIGPLATRTLVRAGPTTLRSRRMRARPADEEPVSEPTMLRPARMDHRSHRMKTLYPAFEPCPT